MATTGRVDLRASFPASTNLSSHQFKLVVLNATPELALAGATAGPAFVLIDKPNAQLVNGTVILAGKTKVIAGGAVNAGDYITPDAAGLAVVAAPATGVNDEVCGIALEDAATTDKFSILAVQFTLQGA